MTAERRPAASRGCPRCAGRGYVYARTITCGMYDVGLPNSECGHLQHYERQRCWLCRGSKRADIVTRIAARVIAAFRKQPA